MRRKKSELVSMVQDVAIQSVDLQVLPSKASPLNCCEGRISRSGGDQDVKHDASIFQYAHKKEENGNVNNSRVTVLIFFNSEAAIGATASYIGTFSRSR
mmetsp:Transcript_23493/g.35700  ORF Transcript_23493/g.35700 Transcript_23493/m.35700 type:complete len:99 (+) Transcript_23493:323-619(+)